MQMIPGLDQPLVMSMKMWIAVPDQDVFEVDTLGDHPFPANPAPETVLRALIARVLAA
jgi:hypothetical protein